MIPANTECHPGDFRAFLDHMNSSARAPNSSRSGMLEKSPTPPKPSAAECQQANAENVIAECLSHDRRVAGALLECRWEQGRLAVQVLGYRPDPKAGSIDKIRHAASARFGEWSLGTFGNRLGLSLTDMEAAVRFHLNCDGSLMRTMGSAQTPGRRPLFTWAVVRDLVLNNVVNPKQFAKRVATKMSCSNKPRTSRRCSSSAS